jgi:hypothetical protein
MSALWAEVEAAIRRAEALDGEARAVAQDVARTLLALHGEGLRRLLTAIEQGRPPATDPAVAGMLELHGLGPGGELIPPRRLAAGPGADGEHSRCELCGERVPAEHGHLADGHDGKLLCACLACGVLFDGSDARYRRVVPHARALAGPPIGDLEWQALEVPVSLAFFRVRAGGGVLAVFPGPAGTTQASVPAAAWSALCRNHPDLTSLVPELEALLVDRRVHPPRQLRVSIDHGYRLVGVLRSSWRGWSGGPQVDGALAAFFEGLQ